jgi:hypothetical protein
MVEQAVTQLRVVVPIEEEEEEEEEIILNFAVDIVTNNQQ